MRRLVVLVVAALALLGSAPQAAAHNVLVEADPAEDASIDTAPEQVTLTFDQAVQPGDVNQIAVTGPDGELWAGGEVTVDDNVVSRSLGPLGPEGQYTVGYAILSADGHTVRGEFTFTLTGAGPASTPPPDADGPTEDQASGDAADADGEDDGVPLWIWIGGAGVLLAGGLVLAIRMGRQD